MSVKVIRKEQGIGLVEVIFSLGIAIIILTSLVSLSVFTLRTSVQNKLLIKGSSYSTQEIELIRAFRDTRPWLTFLGDMNPCYAAVCSMAADGTSVSTSSKTIGTGAEVVTVSFRASGCDALPVDECVRVSVEATWDIGDDTKFVHNYTEFSNWEK